LATRVSSRSIDTVRCLVRLPTAVRFVDRDALPQLLHSFPTRRSSDLHLHRRDPVEVRDGLPHVVRDLRPRRAARRRQGHVHLHRDRKSTRLNSSHVKISYAVFCLKKKKRYTTPRNSRPSTLSTNRSQQ